MRRLNEARLPPRCLNLSFVLDEKGIQYTAEVVKCMMNMLCSANITKKRYFQQNWSVQVSVSGY